MPTAGEAIDGTDTTGWRALRESRPRTGTRSIVGATYVPPSRIYQVRALRAGERPSGQDEGRPAGRRGAQGPERREGLPAPDQAVDGLVALGLPQVGVDRGGEARGVALYRDVAPLLAVLGRSERGWCGKEWGSTGRHRWFPFY